MPESAEKFELGPTYHEEQAQKKQVIVANEQAAVEFILTQNLALLAALNPGEPAPADPQIDADGFAIHFEGQPDVPPPAAA
jgi:hypothetical protein